MIQGTMKTMLFPGKYIQGNGALEQLPEIVSKYGDRAFVLSTKSVIGTARKIIANKGKVEEFNGECCEKEITRVMDLIKKYQSTVVAAVGGGKVIDCCKIAADKLNLPVIIVPTIASNDAPCSGCAVVYSETGVYQYVYYQKQNPDVVLVDTGIIAKAPGRFLISGMGDGLATFFEADACQRSGSLNECGGFRTITALAIARLCMDTILKYGRQAVVDCEKGIISEATEAIIEANILLSGIGFESGGIGAAHAVHNGLTLLSGTHSMYHGEKVAFGVVTGLQLNDKLNIIDEIYDFLIDVNLPVCFADLGVDDVTEEQIIAVAENTCEKESTIYHEPYSFTPQMIAEAMKKADALGKMKKTKRGH